MSDKCLEVIIIGHGFEAATEMYRYSPELVLVSPSKLTMKTSDVIFNSYPTFVTNILTDSTYPIDTIENLFKLYPYFDYYIFKGEPPKGGFEVTKVLDLIRCFRSLGKSSVALVTHEEFIPIIIESIKDTFRTQTNLDKSGCVILTI